MKIPKLNHTQVPNYFIDNYMKKVSPDSIVLFIELLRYKKIPLSDINVPESFLELLKNNLIKVENEYIIPNYYDELKELKELLIYKKNEIRRKSKYIIKKNKISKICSECYSKKNIEIHHVDYNSEYNFVLLCKSCHNKIHRTTK